VGIRGGSVMEMGRWFDDNLKHVVSDGSVCACVWIYIYTHGYLVGWCFL